MIISKTNSQILKKGKHVFLNLIFSKTKKYNGIPSQFNFSLSPN